MEGALHMCTKIRLIRLFLALTTLMTLGGQTNFMSSSATPADKKIPNRLRNNYPFFRSDLPTCFICQLTTILALQWKRYSMSQFENYNS